MLFAVVCVKQRMADGRVRPRNEMPSQKLLECEAPADAARRGLLERFGSANVSSDHISNACTLHPKATPL